MSLNALGCQALLALAGLGVFLSACGGDDGGEEVPSGGSAYLETAEAKLEEAFAGTNKEPPKSGPRPERGKTVWIISCAQSVESCALVAKAEQAAAREIGWETRVFDGKLDPATFNAGIRQALAARADGIILNTVDCPPVKAALQQAKKADVPVVALYSLNCDEASPGEEPLFTSVNYGTEPTYSQYALAWAAPRADWVISQTKGKARVINFAVTDVPSGKLYDKGFKTELKNCTGCRIVDNVRFSAAELGPRLQQKAEQAILKNPDANAVNAQVDAVVLGGVGAAVQASGKADRLAVIGGEGHPANIELIRSDRGQDAANAIDIEWTGWATVDTLNRVLAGQEPAPEGIGWQLVDRDHNLPSSGPYKADIDFKSAYREAWGLAE